MKNILLVINPNAGKRQANKYLTDILILFSKYGYDTRVCLTKEKGDCYEYVKKYHSEAELIVCIGGDGTFNETVGGMIECGSKLPLGYIPAGSTNDFASSLGLSKRIMKAAEDIMIGKYIHIDAGKFNDRYFSYTASFGAFTRVSYATNQNLKNALGHMAYILEGIKEISSIKPVHVKIETDDKVYDDDYIFGAICNSTSLGGMLTLSSDVVDLNDGIFEVMLIKMPKNIIDLNSIIFALNDKNYSSCSMIEFFSAKNAVISADKSISWTLDGEFMQGEDTINMTNIHDAITLIVPDREI